MSFMKKIAVMLLAAVLVGCGTVVDDVSVVVESEPDYSDNILLIVGEGGPSGSMFIKAAHTYMDEHGGEMYEVHNGDEFVAAVRDYLSGHEKIGHLEYFGHGNHIGLYVNQVPNVNGGMYANDPRQNEDWLAASFYDLPHDTFGKNGWIKMNGCNVAEGYPNADTLAQRVADYFMVDVVAPMGPTEFSMDSEGVNPIPDSNFLDSSFDGDVYMVPTYGDAGFVVVKPEVVSEVAGFDDVFEGQIYEYPVAGLVKMGLELDGFEDGRFWPHKNITYGEAVEFCHVVFGEEAACEMDGHEDDEMFRNLRALQIVVDASGQQVAWSDPWYNSYIRWADERGYLTEDFVNKTWYTRAEMAQLVWNFAEVF